MHRKLASGNLRVTVWYSVNIQTVDGVLIYINYCNDADIKIPFIEYPELSKIVFKIWSGSEYSLTCLPAARKISCYTHTHLLSSCFG